MYISCNIRHMDDCLQELADLPVGQWIDVPHGYAHKAVHAFEAMGVRDFRCAPLPNGSDMIVRVEDGGTVVSSGTPAELAGVVGELSVSQWLIAPSVHVRRVLAAFHLVTSKKFKSKKIADDAVLVVRET